jgi:hypothetical protein
VNEDSGDRNLNISRDLPWANYHAFPKGHLPVNDQYLKDSLIGEEWMALRQIASGGKAAEIPHSVQTHLIVLGLIARDHYGRLTLTGRGRRIIETQN